MDPFDSNEVSKAAIICSFLFSLQPLRFTQVLRAKMRQQKSGQHISLGDSIDRIVDKDAQLRQISRRNLDIKRNYELSKQGLLP